MVEKLKQVAGYQRRFDQKDLSGFSPKNLGPKMIGWFDKFG
jgi:hypothetical protein